MNDHEYSRLCNSGTDLTFQLNLTRSYMLNPLSQLLFRINHSEINPNENPFLSLCDLQISKSSKNLELLKRLKVRDLPEIYLDNTRRVTYRVLPTFSEG